MNEIPITEQDNPRTTNIDSLQTPEIVRLINDEDKTIALAVEKVLSQVAQAIDAIVDRLKKSGRLFYIGTGTSGRLGVLDAAECPPTYGVSPELVQGVIAGGYEALYKAVEASEDDKEAGAFDLQKRGVNKKDAVIGIAASGRTPYTIGALNWARSMGCLTIALTCVPGSAITEAAEISIAPLVGPEVITGSTRMKAGTSHKMILNMISTSTMIRLGYVRGNRMTNVLPRNEKLRQRSLRIFIAETGVDEEIAKHILEQSGGEVRVALVMYKTNCSRAEAEKALTGANGNIQNAITDLLG